MAQKRLKGKPLSNIELEWIERNHLSMKENVRKARTGDTKALDIVQQWWWKQVLKRQKQLEFIDESMGRKRRR